MLISCFGSWINDLIITHLGKPALQNQHRISITTIKIGESATSSISPILTSNHKKRVRINPQNARWQNPSLLSKSSYMAASGAYWVYSFAWAAIIKYHRLSGLHNSTLFSHSPGGWKSCISRFGSFRSLTPWLADGLLTLSSHGHLSGSSRV